jgi:hypothetical protein
LFSGRYKALVVDGESPGYLRTVCDYVHLNPSRAGLVKAEEPLEGYPWSSYPWYLQVARRRPEWLTVGRLLGEYGIEKDNAAGRRRFAEGVEQRRGEETGGEWQKLRRGWLHGAGEFREKVLARAYEQVGEHHAASQREEMSEARAERIVREELEQRGWSEEDLTRQRKGDRAKVEMAKRLRSETTMSLKWIAARLKMGAWTHVSKLLSQGKE